MDVPQIATPKNLSTATDTDTDKSVNAFNKYSALDSKEKSDAKKQDDFEMVASDVTNTSAKLSWTCKTIYLSYELCRYNVITKQWDKVATLNKNSIKLKKLLANTTYTYCIKSTSSDEKLGEVTFTTSTTTPVLEIGDYSTKGVNLTFKNVEKYAKVELYRRTDTTGYELLETLAGKTKYVDKDVANAANYTYKIRTVVALGTKDVVSEYSNEVDAIMLLSMGLPNVSGDTKTWAHYQAVTATGSPQYAILNSGSYGGVKYTTSTDAETGIRMVDGCYCAALGSYYGTTIGTKYRITTSTGNQFNIILCDQKADMHTNSTHQYATVNNDIVEFYIDSSYKPSVVDGDYGVLSQFSGSIVSIEKYI